MSNTKYGNILLFPNKKKENDNTGYVNLGEGAGDYELVTRKAYDEVYNDLKKMLEKHGPATVRDYEPDWRTTPRRATLVLSIVQKLPDGEVHLRTADEWKIIES